MKPRTQLCSIWFCILYSSFLGILALCYAGWEYAGDSWRINEHSTLTANGPPIYHFKAIISLAGILMMLQGLAEIVRCIVCLKTGAMALHA